MKTKEIGQRWGLPNLYCIVSVSYDGKRLRRYPHNGACRMIYKLGDVIIKVEDTDDDSQTENEINFYKRIKKRDAVYFPKLIASSLTKKYGVIVQEFVNMSGCHRTRTERKLVKELAKQYKIGDIDHRSNHNWGVNRKTGKPIIYDMGFS